MYYIPLTLYTTGIRPVKGGNMAKTYNAVEAAKAQERYCNEHEISVFSPTNGWCSSCGRNIFEPYTVQHGSETIQLGITVEEAGKRLITGCPHCNHTFCD